MGAGGGAVVVTGTSSGIGRACALALAGRGFTVFAGVRKQADGDELRRAGPAAAIRPVLLDVTDARRIAEVAAEIGDATGRRGLVGLVNNAGVGLPGPVEEMPLERLRHHFDVNVIGQVAVTQAFLPLIRTGGGRVVTIGSAGGWITMPFGGALCATKHALRSLNDALRQELAPWGIPVILVEPGVIRTAALDKVLAGVEPVVAEFDPARRGGYEPGFRAMTEAVAQQEQRRGADPDVVAGIVVHALTARRPRTRYPAGPAARTLINVARLLPNPALDVVRRRLLLRDASTSGSSIGARHG